jgi:hypothetical protein
LNLLLALRGALDRKVERPPFKARGMKQTLSNLCLDESPEQMITWFRRVQHHQVDGRVDVQPGERVFAVGAPHHDAYVCLVETTTTEGISTMENSNSKPLDTRLAGIPANNVPNVVGSWLKRPDAKRADAFPEAPTPLREREDRRR